MDEFVANERATLELMLDAHRAEVASLLEGLDEAAALARLVPPLTTPLGLVKHGLTPHCGG